MVPDLPAIEDRSNVLVVDDDPLLADLLAEWVREKWNCTVINGGAEALDVLDDRFDVVLLDRQMPDVPGEEVLAAIRERDLQVQVMMVSGVEPGFDLVELAIDDYLRKPVQRPALQAKIEGLLLRRTYHAGVERFFTCVAKLDALESALSRGTLLEDERYLTLRAKADELRQDADATLGRPSEHVAELYDVQADD